MSSGDLRRLSAELSEDASADLSTADAGALAIAASACDNARATVRSLSSLAPGVEAGGSAAELAAKTFGQFVDPEEQHNGAKDGQTDPFVWADEEAAAEAEAEEEEAGLVGEGQLRRFKSVADEYLPLLSRVRALLSPLLAEVEGTSIEDNLFSVSVHYRNVAPASIPVVERIVDETLAVVNEEYSGGSDAGAFGSAAGAETKALQASAAVANGSEAGGIASVPAASPEMGLVKKHGKKVLELWPRVNWNKGMAVRWLLSLLGLDAPDVLPIYIGDDLSDEYAFRAIGTAGATKATAVPSSSREDADADRSEASDSGRNLGSVDGSGTNDVGYSAVHAASASADATCSSSPSSSSTSSATATTPVAVRSRRVPAASFDDPEGETVCAGDGIGIIVASRLSSVPWETQARFSLRNPREVRRFLRRLVEAKDEGDAVAAAALARRATQVDAGSEDENADNRKGFRGNDIAKEKAKDGEASWHWSWTPALYEDGEVTAGVAGETGSSSTAAKLSESLHEDDEWTLLK